MNIHHRLFLSTVVILFLSQNIHSFVVPKTKLSNAQQINTKPLYLSTPLIKTATTKKNHYPKTLLFSNTQNDSDDEFDEDPMKVWKEQYPDLEFVDYNDPEYAIDQGTDEIDVLSMSNRNNPDLSKESKEEVELQIEEMREERRHKNDIFQFETYYQNVWKSGKHDYYGDWTIYDTILSKVDDTNNDGNSMAVTALRKRKDMQKVISKAIKQSKDGDDTNYATTVITHSEECTEGKDISRYYPKEITSYDFRGPQGIMTVGNAYTICDTTLLEENNNQHSGPYKTMNAEVGLYKDNLRFRLKLSYSIHDEDNDSNDNDNDDSIISTHPPLYLKNVIICRESTLDFPNPNKHTSLYESLGAPGGLYDPPPILKENQYLQLDLEGRATALFPSKIDQDIDYGTGWVFTLDWTTDELRYQADRKVFGGLGVKGLYRLELSEVRGEESELWRPNKGPQNMSQ